MMISWSASALLKEAFSNPEVKITGSWEQQFRSHPASYFVRRHPFSACVVQEYNAVCREKEAVLEDVRSAKLLGAARQIAAHPPIL